MTYPADYQAQRDALLALIETQGDAELMRIAWRIAGWPYAPVQVPDDSALEALADRMAARREASQAAQRPCCHTTGPLHHPACDQPKEGK